MTSNKYNKTIGNTGEDLAVRFLEGKGYKILVRNFLIRGGEVDIIARDLEFLVFVEVKARFSHQFGLPSESLNYWKLKALQKTALFYIQKINWGDKPYRFDLVSIDYTNSKESPEVELIKSII